MRLSVGCLSARISAMRGSERQGGERRTALDEAVDGVAACAVVEEVLELGLDEVGTAGEGDVGRRGGGGGGGPGGGAGEEGLEEAKAEVERQLWRDHALL